MRDRFVCRECGVRFEGNARPDGRITPDDRAAADTATEPRPALCWSCADTRRIARQNRQGEERAS